MGRVVLGITLAIALAVVAAWCFAEGPADRAIAFLSALLLEAIGGSVYSGLRTVLRLDRPDPGHEAADGIVPLFELDGVPGSPNGENAALKALVRLEIEDDRRPGVRKPIRGDRLIGRLAIFCFFLGRDGRYWSDREIAAVFGALSRMGIWLEGEASRHGVPLNLELCSTYVVSDDPEPETVELSPSLDPFETTLDEVAVDVKTLASASRASARLGAADFGDITARLGRLAGHDQVAWFLFPFREGRSRAIAPRDSPDASLRVVICFGREANASAPLKGRAYVESATLAHEFLHLFGATDKYGTSTSSFGPDLVSRRDVMRLDTTRLERLRIDRLTATEIGWKRARG